MFGGKTDPDAVERFKTTLDAKLAAYDVILGKTKYLAGDVSCAHMFSMSYHTDRVIRADTQEITLADLFHLPYGALLPAQGIDVLESGKYPNVTRYVL